MNQYKITKIFQIVFIVLSMLLFLGSHLLQEISRLSNDKPLFFGLLVSLNLFIDVLILISFVLLISVIVSLLLEILK